MSNRSPLAATFFGLHQNSSPLVIPNPWDVGSARVLVALDFKALATTSSGFAGTLGRRDGSVTRAEALNHARAIAQSVKVPVSADLENGFAHEPAGVADTIDGAFEAGLAGCSIEDWSGAAIYDIDLAVARVKAAADAARGRLVLTARAENHIHSHFDLTDTITRLRRYQDVGADVLYAPGLIDRHDIESLVQAVDRPVNVLLLPGGPGVPELAELGVRRISIGGSFAFAALGTLVQAAREIQGPGPYSFWDLAGLGRGVTSEAWR